MEFSFIKNINQKLKSRSQSVRYFSLGLNKSAKKYTYFHNANKLTHTVEWQVYNSGNHFMFYEFQCTFPSFRQILQNIKELLNVLMTPTFRFQSHNGKVLPTKITYCFVYRPRPTMYADLPQLHALVH